MKILLSWLKEYLPLSATPEVIAATLTNAGIEVDHIEPLIPSFTGVIAARIDDVEALSSGNSKVILFDGKTKHQVVTGASNCKKGMLTAYAPVGATVAGKTVGIAAVDGLESSGFLCSEKELELTDYHDGVVELEESVQPGALLADYFSDVVFDVALTPNLGAAFSVMGIARELSAFFDIPLLKKPWIEPVTMQGQKLDCTIDKDVACARYSGILVESAAVCPSRSLMRVRLERSDIGSINNIVDVTNYVCLELGQPLHAFDADRVEGQKIIVRNSRPDEQLTLLDGIPRTLPQNAVVIADEQKVLAVAGIMGGEFSGVNEKTTRIIFEAASFGSASIRKTGKALGVHTDSSKRFERGTDQNCTLRALQFAYALLGKTCPNEKLVAVGDHGGEKQSKSIACRLSRISKILGFEVSVNEAETSFKKLFLPYSWDGQDTFTIHPPSFRNDINEEVDLIEEVGRLVGLERENGTPPKYAASNRSHDPLYGFTKEVRARLVALGLQEFLCCDLISPEMANMVKTHIATEKSIVKVMNPLSLEQSVLRQSLLPGLLDSLKRNLSHRILDVRAFEIGHVHLKLEDCYREPLVFGVMLSGKAELHHFARQSRNVDFFDIKGTVENLFASLGFVDVSFEASTLPLFHPGRQAKVYVSGCHVGMIGELHPSLLRKLDISQEVFFAECDLQELLQITRKEQKMSELASYPSSERDWTITLPKSVTYKALMDEISAVRPPILEDISLVAIFEHEKLGKDRHNVTIHFVYRDRHKTVSQEEVDKAHEELVTKVGCKFS